MPVVEHSQKSSEDCRAEQTEFPVQQLVGTGVEEVPTEEDRAVGAGSDLATRKHPKTRSKASKPVEEEEKISAIPDSICLKESANVVERMLKSRLRFVDSRMIKTLSRQSANRNQVELRTFLPKVNPPNRWKMINYHVD